MLCSSNSNEESKQNKWTHWYKCKPTCIPVSILLTVIVLVIVLSILDEKLGNIQNEFLQNHQHHPHHHHHNILVNCKKSCQASIVESIPEGIIFNKTPPHLSTYNAWIQLLELAKYEINIGSFYWSLQGKEYEHPTGIEGKNIFNKIQKIGQEKQINIKIAQDLDTKSFPNYDTHDLEKYDLIKIRRLNFTNLMGSGVLHTKIWIIDTKHVYIGSANMDWRSLTQVKELGILVTNCSCFAQDVQKIFNVYWKLGENNSKIPEEWPIEYETEYNSLNPMKLILNNNNNNNKIYNTYISSSPSRFCPKGRNIDLDAIIHLIDNAKHYIHIAVMDYFPGTLYTSQHEYWPNIDNKIKSAAINHGIKIKLLMSKWNNTRSYQFNFLKSLQDLNGIYSNVDIQIKLFEIPSTPDQSKIPFARVNHNKYMVTDSSGYIGTSNWSGDYFMTTAGVGIIFTPTKSNSNNNNNNNNTSTNTTTSGNKNGNIGEEGEGTNQEEEDDDDLRTQLNNIFERDWNSVYASTLK